MKFVAFIFISISVGCSSIYHLDNAAEPYTITETATCAERSPKDEMLLWNGARWVNVTPKCKATTAILEENVHGKESQVPDRRTAQAR